jgi:hypothetical protein
LAEERNATRIEVQSPPPELVLESLRKHAVPHTGVLLDLVNSPVTPERITSFIQSISRLGLNMLQLRLISDHGFHVRLESIPQLVHNVVWVGVPYEEMDLQNIVASASQVGMEVVPEFSITTNAGGCWFASGMTVAGPHVIFEQGRGIVHNITDNVVLPLVATVIRSFRDIFSSSNYIHLGSDEREEAMLCLHEARLEKTDFDSFEKRLSYLLEWEDLYKPDHLLRWQNREGKRYDERTGRVTHYRANDTPNPPTGESSLLRSICLLGGLVYQNTHHLKEQNPTGLLAEVRVLDEIPDTRLYTVLRSVCWHSPSERPSSLVLPRLRNFKIRMF